MNSANAARRRLITIGLGWVSVAVLEAIAYTTLALSIADHRSPVLVLATAAIALFVTVLVSRGGYFTGGSTRRRSLRRSRRRLRPCETVLVHRRQPGTARHRRRARNPVADECSRAPTSDLPGCTADPAAPASWDRGRRGARRHAARRWTARRVARRSDAGPTCAQPSGRAPTRSRGSQQLSRHSSSPTTSNYCVRQPVPHVPSNESSEAGGIRKPRLHGQISPRHQRHSSRRSPPLCRWQVQ